MWTLVAKQAGDSPEKRHEMRDHHAFACLLYLQCALHNIELRGGREWDATTPYAVDNRTCSLSVKLYRVILHAPLRS